MKKLYINNTKYIQLSKILLAVVFLGTFVTLPLVNFSERASFGLNLLITITGMAISLLIIQSRFMYQVLERTDENTLTTCNNLFGFRINPATHSIRTFEQLRTRQDSKNYYVIELLFQNGSTFQLGKFAVKSQLIEFENAVNELIKR